MALPRSLIPPETLRPIRRSEYERMVELGLFENERVELLEGMLVTMSPQGTEHVETVMRLVELLVSLLKGRARVLVQAPLGIAEDSLPEPDLALIPVADYSATRPAEAYLIIEVSDTSLQKDRLFKRRLYARAGIPEYWIVNLGSRAVEICTLPENGDYTHETIVDASGTVRPTRFPEVEVRVSEILPTAPRAS